MIRKKYLIPVIALLIMIAAATTALAEEGWVQSGNDWYYYDKYGSMVTSEWKKGNDGLWRWLDYSGKMTTNMWVDDIYYVGADSLMTKEAWQKLSDSDGIQYWYYFDTNGKKITEKWKKVSEKWYYFDEMGHMLTGWILDNTYYCKDDGSMTVGWGYLEDPEGNSEDSPFFSDTLGDTHWYYFLTSGKIFKATEDQYVTRKIDGLTYCFDQNGAMQTGWVDFEIEAKAPIESYRYFNTDGTIRTGWYSIQPPEALEGNYESSVCWFCFDNKGVPRCSEGPVYTSSDIVRIGDKRYLFNEYGTPVYGLQKIYETRESDDWTAYYFGPNSNACNMMNGKQSVLEDDGERYTYYFTKTGMGYTGVYGGVLYYKGKLQKSDQYSKYTVISIPTKSGTYENYLVNVSGMVQKNKKKMKDGDGYVYATNASGIVITVDEKPVDSSDYFTPPSEPYFGY